MSYSLNVAVVQGRLVVSPELKKTNNGTSVCTFRIAVQTDKENTSFIDIVAWQHTAEFVANHFKKGDGIIVRGELVSRVYDAKLPGSEETFKKTVYEVRANDITFPITKKEPNTSNYTQPSEKPLTNEISQDFIEIDASDDLPF